MNISFFSVDDTADQTLQSLKDRLPQHSLRAWPDIGNPVELDCAICWGPPPDFFDRTENLKAIFSLAAGVDHLLNHPGLPEGVPIIRLWDAGMADKIAEYVHFGVLRWHRHFDLYQHQQSIGLWQPEQDIDAADYRVGVMGMGVIGSRIASKLQAAGYQVSGWKRTEADTAGDVPVYYGNDQLADFLAQLNTLVCVLPLTPQTNGIVDYTLLHGMPKGASFINVGRGGQVVQKDLLATLDENHISGALLDVCDPEPLTAEHPLWAHPNILLTPHIAGPTQISLSVDQIAEGIRQLDAGVNADQLGHGLVNKGSGY